MQVRSTEQSLSNRKIGDDQIKRRRLVTAPREVLAYLRTP